MTAFRYVIAVALLAVFLSSNTYSARLKEGEPPPTFTLIDENGTKVNFDDLLDKPSVIYFTHNACHYCTQIIAMLKRADKKFGSDDLRIMGVNVMAKDKKLVHAYKVELGFTFPMFAGNRSDVLKAYKIYYVPKLIFIDRNKIVNKIVGHYILEPGLHKNIREIMEHQ
jgi:peroxiredoxin